MRQITCISTACSEKTPELLREIQRQSQHRNARDGLSGLLLFDGVRFLLILEGEAKAVTATLERIRNDKRHLGMVLLADKRIERAQFGTWAMLCRDARASINDLQEALRPYLRDADRTTQALFESFAALRARAA